MDSKVARIQYGHVAYLSGGVKICTQLMKLVEVTGLFPPDSDTPVFLGGSLEGRDFSFAQALELARTVLAEYAADPEDLVWTESVMRPSATDVLEEGGLESDAS